MIMSLQLLHVYYMPVNLEPGILYFSAEFQVAGHLCPCGCGNKVITPLGPAGWSFTEVEGAATLDPSLGNWELPCRSHYWIIEGKVVWADQWNNKRIKAGRKREEQKRRAYYKQLGRQKAKAKGFLRFFAWLITR
jgi:hypothetical protein